MGPTDITDTPPILVLGATGSVGSRVVARLCRAGALVKAASRHSSARFDWGDTVTWEPVLRGVGRIFLMAPDGVPVDPEFVRLAADHKVEHIVLLSSRAIEVIGDQRLLDAEAAVRDSGVGWTIVRADWFAQNFNEGPFREAVLAGELALPLGGCRQAFVDADDIAAVAAQALTEPGHAGRTYEVTGPRALSFGEACAVIGDAIGRPLRFSGDPDSYLAAQTALGRSEESVRQDIAAFNALTALGDAVPLDTVERVTGRPARTFEEYAAAAAQSGHWRRRPEDGGGDGDGDGS